jgi:putative hemolysin
LEDVLILVLLLILSAFFSGSETALTTLSIVRVETLANNGRIGARSLRRLKSNTNRMLITILIGNNLVNIGASAMATVIATEKFGHLGPALAVGALTLFILVFGEITPKTFAARYAVSIGLMVAPPLLVFSKLVFPMAWAMEHLAVALQNLTPAKPDPFVTEAELIRLAEHGAREGTIEEDEQEIIERVFAFDALRAENVMTPRHRIVALDGSRTVREALPDIVAAKHSRIPLHPSGKPDEIESMVHIRDVLSVVAEERDHVALTEIGFEPMFVPLNHRIDDLFEVLRNKDRHLIIVVNEHGELQGLFTLEDMLEELVGEIQSDREPRHVNAVVEEPGQVLADGAVEMRVVMDALNIDLDCKATDSANLWLLNHVERIPAGGEVFCINGLEVEIVNASRRQVKKLRIRKV